MILVHIKQKYLDSSIFLKILSVIILSALIVNIVVTIFFNVLIFTPVKSVNQFVFKCANYVMDDLESSMSTEKGSAIAADFGLEYRHEFNGRVTASTNRIPALSEITIQKVIDKSNQFLGFHEGKLFLILKRDSGTYILVPKFYLDSMSPEIWIIIVLLLLSIIFFAIYHSLKKLLSPIHELKEGVDQLKGGNFDYSLKVTSKDELGNLTAAFNKMTRQVKDLLFSKEQLLLNVSHELRSPLTRMKLIMEFIPENTRKTDLLNDISLMEAMVTELLETAKLDNINGDLTRQKTDLIPLITDVYGNLRHISPGINCIYPLEPVMLPMDAAKIRTVLKNILENALKYSIESRQPVSLSVSKSTQVVTMEISDSGEGIPEKDLPHIFEPFYRVDKSRSKETGGYGLGLAICKQIVDAHQGKISIKSIPGQGTTVTIELPLN
ncbi:HAMP domain-containing histidine kinase [bacterium]|nr:HAMP domain-containing histidine kinase [bacterium]